MTRTTVYVDGLNLYSGALRHTDYKWLDLAAFGRKLISVSDQLVTEVLHCADLIERN